MSSLAIPHEECHEHQQRSTLRLALNLFDRVLLGRRRLSVAETEAKEWWAV